MDNNTIQEAHQLVQDAGRVAGLASLYASFIDSAADAWVIAEWRPDKSMVIALFNHKAELLFGWKAEQVIGRPLEMLLPESLRAVHAETHTPGFVRDPYSRAMGAQRDLNALRKDGSTFPVNIDLDPQRSWDGVLFVRAAVRVKPQSVQSPTAVASESAAPPISVSAQPAPLSPPAPPAGEGSARHPTPVTRNTRR